MSQTVKIDSVVKRYGDFTAVDNVSLDIKEGSFYSSWAFWMRKDYIIKDDCWI